MIVITILIFLAILLALFTNAVTPDAFLKLIYQMIEYVYSGNFRLLFSSPLSMLLNVDRSY